MLDFIATVKKEGFKTWRTLSKLRNARQADGAPRSVRLRQLQFPILIRPATEDAGTVINNVIREEYGRFRLSGDPEWMIDAGAYIGDTSAYFLSRFPKLKVIALEPNPPSYKVARQNLEPYGGRVTLLNMGLFSTERNLFFEGDDTSAAIAIAGVKVECTTILSLMDRFSIPRLSILKMDIEGAEESIFLSRPEDWLSRIDLLLIEIHGDHIQPLVTRVLDSNGFSMKRYRSIWCCRRK